MTVSTQHITKMLTESGIRPSIQRIAVTGHLISQRTHPTADEIYQSLLKEYPTMSRTTVYNTLKRLAEARKITILDIEPGMQRFDSITEPHAHFICKKCGAIHDITLVTPPTAPHGYLITETHVTFRGVCEKCHSTQI